MAVLEIRKFNDPILRKKCEEVEEITTEIKTLIDTMAETMEKNQGVGLAAPQIGISKRIIVMKRDTEKSRLLALVNPRIIKKSTETDMQEEGCLSFPDIFLAITRAREVEVEGLDGDGRKITIQANGLVARIFQHEVDHIDGILFFNRLSFIEKIKFKLKHSSIKL